MKVEGALIDLDGTVYRGNRLLAGAAEGIATLRSANIDVQFLSNSPTKHPAEYHAKLRTLGIPVDQDEILTSSVVAAEYLGTHHPNANVYVIGEPPLVSQLMDAGITVTDDPDNVGIVLASMDRTLDYEKLSTALDALCEDTLIYATNPDQTCPVETGEIPDTGAVIGAIKGMTGRNPDLILGKPSPITVEMALDRLDVDPTRCLMIGDRLETDGQMGSSVGLSTAIVLTGVTQRTELATAESDPDFVLDSLADVASVID